MRFLGEALVELRPNANWNLVGDEYEGIEWLDTEQTQPTLEEVNAKVAELESKFNAKQYQRDRKKAYASIEEQLDMQYWDSVNGTDTWKQHIDAVKTAHPKPTE